MSNKRIEQLEANVAELRALKEKYTLDDLTLNKVNEWALRYGLLESIQIVIDIACHLVVRYNLGTAHTYAECIVLLRKFEYITPELETRLKAMAGLRNLLVHEYVKIDTAQLYNLLDELDDFGAFARAIEKYL